MMIFHSGETVTQIGKLEAAAEQKSEEIVTLKRDLNHVTSSLTELTKRHVKMIDDNNDLRMQVQTMKEDQKLAYQQVLPCFLRTSRRSIESVTFSLT